MGNYQQPDDNNNGSYDENGGFVTRCPFCKNGSAAYTIGGGSYQLRCDFGHIFSGSEVLWDAPPAFMPCQAESFGKNRR